MVHSSIFDEEQKITADDIISFISQICNSKIVRPTMKNQSNLVSCDAWTGKKDTLLFNIRRAGSNSQKKKLGVIAVCYRDWEIEVCCNSNRK